MKTSEEIWVPSAAVVPQERGAEYLAPVDGADWSNGVGFNRGFFSAFRIPEGKDVWFHFPLPTPLRSRGRPMLLTAVSLMWETIDAAAITWIVLHHGGMERIALTERLAEPPYEAVPFEPPEQWREYHPASARRLTRLPFGSPLALRFGLQLSIGVRAEGGDGTVRFYGAGAEFSEA